MGRQRQQPRIVADEDFGQRLGQQLTGSQHRHTGHCNDARTFAQQVFQFVLIVRAKVDHLQYLFQKAKVEYVIDDELLQKMHKLDQYLQTRFKLAFGNRIIKQMYDFIPVYVACGGTELGGMDYIIARKVLKKFESMNVSFVRDEMKGLIEYIEKTFGEGGLPDSVMYLQRIQNFY